jgi:probable phosphoglycerate mutase
VLGEVRAAVGETIAFGHGHMLRVLAARWLGLPPEDGALLALATGAVCTLGYEHELPVIVHWNQPPA